MELPGNNKETLLNQLRRVLSSTVLLSTAYIITFLIQQYVTGMMCNIFGYDPVISYNGISNLPFDYRYWSFNRVAVIFSAGPLTCLITGILLFSLFSSLHGHNTLYRVFFLWMGTCCINLFLAFLLLAPIGIEQYHTGLYTGFSIIGTWSRMNSLAMVPVAVISVIVSIIVGHILSGNYLKFSFTSKIIYSQKARVIVITQIFLLPVLFATPFLLWLTNSKSLPLHIFQIANLLIMTMGMYAGSDTMPESMNIAGKDVLNKVSIIWIAIAIAVYEFVWVILR